MDVIYFVHVYNCLVLVYTAQWNQNKQDPLKIYSFKIR